MLCPGIFSICRLGLVGAYGKIINYQRKTFVLLTLYHEEHLFVKLFGTHLFMSTICTLSATFYAADHTYAPGNLSKKYRSRYAAGTVPYHICFQYLSASIIPSAALYSISVSAISQVSTSAPA